MVSLYNWNSVVKRLPNVYYFGQHIFLQMCLYQNKGDSKYLMFFDVDEFMKVVRGDGIEELVDYLESTYSKDYALDPPDEPVDPVKVTKQHVSAFSFANWFFRNTCSPRPESKREIDSKHIVNLVTQRVLWKTWIPARWNWKHFAHTREVMWLGVAFVGDNMNNESTTGFVKLDLSEGSLNHYRHKDKFDVGKPCAIKRNYVRDPFMQQYGAVLLDKVNRRSSQVWKGKLQ